MILFNAMLLHQPSENVLIFDILTDFTLFLLLCLKTCGTMTFYIKQHENLLCFLFDLFLTCNVLKITCSIPMEDFSLNFKVFILITTCLVLCLKNKTFVVMMQNSVLRGIILIYVNDMPQTILSTLLLYADDSCILYQHKDVVQIEKQLNEDSENLCDSFVNNKLSIHFGEDKTKSILLASKWRAKNIHELIIKYKNINITQHLEVTYLGCMLDKTMSGKPMALKVINKINSKLKFL